MFEILGKRKKVKYLNKINADDHYGYSPYRFIPENSIKLSSDTSIDLGEGLLRLFNYNEKNKIDIFRKKFKNKNTVGGCCNWVTQIVQKLFAIQKILIGFV